MLYPYIYFIASFKRPNVCPYNCLVSYSARVGAYMSFHLLLFTLSIHILACPSLCPGECAFIYWPSILPFLSSFTFPFVQSLIFLFISCFLNSILWHIARNIHLCFSLYILFCLFCLFFFKLNANRFYGWISPRTISHKCWPLNTLSILIN